MALSRVDHVWQLDQGAIAEFVGVVARLRCILGASSDKNAAIVCLDRAEPDWDVEINVEHFSLLSLLVDIEKSDYLLVELEEVDLVGVDHLHLVSSRRLVHHSDASRLEVVRHGELGVPVEADVLLVLSLAER